MPKPEPILVYSKYVSDLPRFRRLLDTALPEVAIDYAGSPEEAAPHLGEAQILYGWGFSADLLRRMPKLRWVQKMGAGVDDIIGEWPFGPEVVLTRTDGRLIAARMSEYVLGAILDKTSGFDKARALQTERRWDYFEPASITDLTVGIAGLGEIGSDVARTLATLEVTVVGWRRSGAACPFVHRLHTGAEGLTRFVSECDVLVLVLPLTDATRGLFGDAVLARCRPGAHLINVGRGAVIDEDALLRALTSGRVGHATLDVFAREPLPREHPFWNHARITPTPHICGPLIPEKVVPHFVANYAAFARGEPLRHVVDPKRQY